MSKSLVSQVRQEIVQEQADAVQKMFQSLSSRVWMGSPSGRVLLDAKQALDMMSELSAIHGALKGLANGYDWNNDDGTPSVLPEG